MVKKVSIPSGLIVEDSFFIDVSIHQQYHNVQAFLAHNCVLPTDLVIEIKNMIIVFKDKNGNVEMLFNEIRRDSNGLCFTVQVSHNPFMAVMDVGFSFQEISMFTKGLSDMKKRIINQLTFASNDREIVINLTMEITGHIYSSVIMNAGSRGYLNFKFDFDQSFIDEMFNDVCVN